MTEQNKPAPIQGTVTVDYQVFKELESKAAAHDALDPKNAAAGVEIANKAKEVFTVESQDKGAGVISFQKTELYELIQLITGVKPIQLTAWIDDHYVQHEPESQAFIESVEI